MLPAVEVSESVERVKMAPKCEQITHTEKYYNQIHRSLSDQADEREKKTINSCCFLSVF